MIEVFTTSEIIGGQEFVNMPDAIAALQEPCIVNIVTTFEPSPEGGYMLTHKEVGVFQYAADGIIYWYPYNGTAGYLIHFFHTRQDATEVINILTHVRDETTGTCNPDDFSILPFDHTLERTLWDETKWSLCRIVVMPSLDGG